MNEHTWELSPTCGLLDLPDATLESIVRRLATSDKIALLPVCKKAANVAAMVSAKATLKITKDTRFSGIKQVNN
jgi:hypothetical protein